MGKVREGFDFTMPSYTFGGEDFAGMADALGVGPLEQEYRDVLQGECFRFLVLEASWQQAPRPRSIRKHLEKVHSDAVRLMKTLDALDDADASDRPARQAAMHLLHISAPDNDWAAIDTDLMKFSERLAALGKAANDAISDLPEDRGGDPGDFPLEALVRRLAPIFTKITGQRPTITYDDYGKADGKYTGPFVSFLTAFLAPLDAHYQKSHQGLGKTVQRVLNRMQSQ